MPEMTTELDRWAAERIRAAHASHDRAPLGGRHAYDERRAEEAALTPIFHALTRGGWRRRQYDPTDSFRRDPLTAPLPRQSGTGGRHHL